MELGRGNDVVVKRPESGVGEPFVIELNIARAEFHGNQVHAAVAEGFQRFVRRAVPAHPRAVGLGHHRRKGSHQAARRAAPAFLAVFRVIAGVTVYRKAVGDHHEIVFPGPWSLIAFGCAVGFFACRLLHCCPLGLPVTHLPPYRRESSRTLARSSDWSRRPQQSCRSSPVNWHRCPS
ncbi:hypothetical protein AHiyo1_19370 [Arthrobacter sp. Hiyo1]|nr:hypothetical protein AHiyo1_19370 [Arthrobacter sp. Hiyo1]